MAFGLTTIGQIAIPVGDIERAVDFYRAKLGVKFLFEVSKMAFFDCGGIRVMLTPAEEKNACSGSMIYFKVDEMEAAAHELKTRGVTFERDPHLVARMPDHDLWMAFFRDPDHNALALMCEVKR